MKVQLSQIDDFESAPSRIKIQWKERKNCTRQKLVNDKEYYHFSEFYDECKRFIRGSCDGALQQTITIYTNSSSVANGYSKVVSDLPICALHDVQHLLKQLHIKKEWKLQTH